LERGEVDLGEDVAIKLDEGPRQHRRCSG
jgi:hypothetical protein